MALFYFFNPRSHGKNRSPFITSHPCLIKLTLLQLHHHTLLISTNIASLHHTPYTCPLIKLTNTTLRHHPCFIKLALLQLHHATLFVKLTNIASLHHTPYMCPLIKFRNITHLQDFLTCLFKLFQTIKLGFCKSHPTTGVFLNFEKAFDQVWFDGILFKLSSMGLNRKLIRWISNFLYQRKLIISINDQLSDPITPIHGSPLSPILFILYVSDIPYIHWKLPNQLNSWVCILTITSTWNYI